MQNKLNDPPKMAHRSTKNAEKEKKWTKKRHT